MTLNRFGSAGAAYGGCQIDAPTENAQDEMIRLWGDRQWSATFVATQRAGRPMTYRWCWLKHSRAGEPKWRIEMNERLERQVGEKR